MKDYKKLNLPLLTEDDEEYKMLYEVAEERERQKNTKTAEKKSGDATEIVVRKHLQKHGFNVSQNCVYVNPSSREIDLLILRDGEITNPEKKYSSNQVRTVLEIKNNAVGGKKVNDEILTPSGEIRQRFDDIENATRVNRFAVLVLSEKLLSRTPYPYAIDEAEIGKKNCRVFTCVLRRKWAKLYEKAVVIEMLKNGELWKSNEWEDFIAFLKE